MGAGGDSWCEAGSCRVANARDAVCALSEAQVWWQVGLSCCGDLVSKRCRCRCWLPPVARCPSRWFASAASCSGCELPWHSRGTPRPQAQAPSSPKPRLLRRDASGGHQRSRPQPLPWSSGRPLETSDASGKSGQRHDKRADAEHSPAPANGMVVSRGPGSGLEPNPAAAVRRRFGHLAAMLQGCWQLFTPEAETRSRSRSRSPRLPWVPGRVPRARRGKPAVCPLLEERLDDWCAGVLSAARVSRYCAAAVRRPPSFAALLAPD